MSTDLVVIGLGSNLQQPIKNLRRALAEIKKLTFLKVLDVSAIYESKAQTPKDSSQSWQQDFLNAAVLIQMTGISPVYLLQKLKEIEIKMGRIIAEKWSPRLIDLDILHWENLIFSEPELKIPHPHLSERPFALLPLLDVLPAAKVVRPAWAAMWVGEKPFSTKKSSTHFWPQLMGILNLTVDSFSEGDQLNYVEQRLKKLIDSKADIIDIGAESTRPAATKIDGEIEWQRLKMGLSLLNKLDNKVQVSIDSYKPQVIAKCLNEFKIDFINDVMGLRDPEMLKVLNGYKNKVIVMHSLSVPPKPEEILSDSENPIQQMSRWWQEKLGELKKHGLDNDQLIFDPGIGFGKSRQQNNFILNHLEQFSELTTEILIGHSRKSYQTLFSDRAASFRDLETALTTQKLNLAFTQYLRIHDIESQTISLRSR